MAKLIVRNVVSASEHWQLEHPQRPCPPELDALVREGILIERARDPWGTPPLVTGPGRHDPDAGADVVSAGPDRRAGTGDDIRSWEL